MDKDTKVSVVVSTKHTTDIIPGDRLIDNVVDDKNNVLLRAGLIFDESTINVLRRRGIDEVTVGTCVEAEEDDDDAEARAQKEAEAEDDRRKDFERVRDRLEKHFAWSSNTPEMKRLHDETLKFYHERIFSNKP